MTHPTFQFSGILSMMLLLMMTAAEQGVKFTLKNLAGERIRVYWDGNGQLVPQTALPLRNSSLVSINSYQGHRFVVGYARGSEEDMQEHARKEGASFVVGEANDVVTIHLGLHITHDDPPHQAHEMLNEVWQHCVSETPMPCMKEHILHRLKRRADTVHFEQGIYRQLHDTLEAYQCDSEVGHGKRSVCTDSASQTLAEADDNLGGPGKLDEIIPFNFDEIVTSLANQCAPFAIAEPQQVTTVPDGLLGRLSSMISGSQAFEEISPLPDQLLHCMAPFIEGPYTWIAKRLTRLRNAKGVMSESVRNMTCSDPAMDTTGPDVEDFTWTTKFPKFQADGTCAAVDEEVFHLHQLVNRNRARVVAVDEFVSEYECEHLVRAAEPHLKRATVNEEGNNTAVSAYRNSFAANIVPNHADSSDPAYRVQQRVFDLTNSLTSYGLSIVGQEPFSAIQYQIGHEYRPHCDGSCDGSFHLHGGRVATLLLYCDVASGGGATTFTKAGAFVKPKSRQAVFFSYRGDDERMDNELTEHSACPVTEGVKWSITQWMREGVSDHDPWTKFDPIGSRL